jgi:hypothetical protein
VIHFQTAVNASCAPHGGIAQLHGFDFGHRVDDVCEAVLGVGADVLGAGWRVVIEDFDGAVGFYQVEVFGRADGDGFMPRSL